MRITLLVLGLAGCTSNNVNNNQPEDMSIPEGDFAVVPDQGSMACDPIKQDCPMGQKCAVSGGMMPTATCVMAGTVTDGMPCMRMMGADNCAAGLTCSCGAGRGQMLVGSCAPSCKPFGNDCGALNCSGLVTAFGAGGGVFFTCRTPGMTANFDDCTMGGSCGENAFCDQNAGWCAPLCDATHSCPPTSGDAGVTLSCMSLQSGLTGDPGYCAH